VKIIYKAFLEVICLIGSIFNKINMFGDLNINMVPLGLSLGVYHYEFIMSYFRCFDRTVQALIATAFVIYQYAALGWVILTIPILLIDSKKIKNKNTKNQSHLSKSYCETFNRS